MGGRGRVGSSCCSLVFKHQLIVISLSILVATSLSVPRQVYAAERVLVVSPGEAHFAGQPLLFHIQSQEFAGPVKGTVFYRTIGVRSFRKLDMTAETEVDLRVLLDASRVAPPGIEYFFSIEDSKGDIFTFPADNPRQDPYQLKISLDESPPKITDLTPASSGKTPSTKPVVSASYTDDESTVLTESVRITLDGVDVTQMANVSPEKVTYTPPGDLSYGDHTVTVDLTDLSGNRLPTRSWTFAVAKTERFKELTGQLNITGEVKTLIGSKDGNTSPEWTFQSNIGLTTKMETESVKTSLTANMFYQEEEGPGPAGDAFNLTNYLLQVEKGKTKFSLGDLNARGTELLSPSIARRGALLAVAGEKTSTEVFALRSNAVTGFDHILGFDDPDQLLAGGTVERVMGADGTWTLKVAALSGKNAVPDDYNASTLQPGTEGQAYSLGVVGRIGKGNISLTGEIAGTNYDKDIAGGEDKETDTAYLARIAGSGGAFTWGGSYRLLGADFRSIANPTGASDREEISVNGGYRTGPSNFTLTLATNHDNVDDDPTRAVIGNNTGSLNYTFSKADLPTVFLNQTLILQESSDEPVGYTPIENETYTATLGASYARPTWNISPNFILTSFDDQGGVTNNDSDTTVLTVSGSYRPSPSISLSPSLSMTNLESDAAGTTTETTQGALNAQFKLKGDQLTLHTTLSQLENSVDDGTLDISTFSGTVQLNWKFLSGHDETFSLRGQYSSTENKVADTEVEDYTIYAVFSFGVPVTLF